MSGLHPPPPHSALPSSLALSLSLSFSLSYSLSLSLSSLSLSLAPPQSPTISPKHQRMSPRLSLSLLSLAPPVKMAEIEMDDLGGGDGVEEESVEVEVEVEVEVTLDDSSEGSGENAKRRRKEGGAVERGRQEEDMPEARQKSARGASWPRGLLTFLKAMLGAAMLSLPHAFGEGGVLVSVLTYIFVGSICMYCQSTLIEVKQDLEEKDQLVQTFSAVGRRVLGRQGEAAIVVLVVVLEWAFCSGILLVISSTVNTVVSAVPTKAVIVILLPFLAVISSIRLLREMWVLVYFGCFVYFVGVLGVVFYYGFSTWDEHITDPVLVNWKAIPAMIGSAVYSIEGINLVLPVEGALKKKAHGKPVILAGSIIVVALNSSFAAFSYLFGFVALATALFFTYPVALYPATEMIEDVLLPRKADVAWKESKRVAVRTVQVLLTGVVALVTPDFGLYTSLLGAMCMSIIGFVIPPLIYVVHKYGRLHPLEVAFNVCIIIGGVVFFFVGTSTSAAAIIRYYFPSI